MPDAAPGEGEGEKPARRGLGSFIRKRGDEEAGAAASARKRKPRRLKRGKRARTSEPTASPSAVRALLGLGPTSLFGRFAFAVGCGLLGAAIVHIVTVLAVPRFSRTTAYDAAVARAEPGVFAPVPSSDPYLRSIVCRFDLDQPVRVVGGQGVPFWSASVFVPGGENVYSLNDRTSEGELDLVIIRPEALEELRDRLVEDGPELVSLDEDTAVIVVRTFVPDPTMEEIAAAFLEEAECGPLDFE